MLGEGAPADVAIFDPAAIGSSNHGVLQYDLPGGAKRIVMPSRGVAYTVVNGAVTWEQERLKDAKAGVVFRGRTCGGSLFRYGENDCIRKNYCA